MQMIFFRLLQHPKQKQKIHYTRNILMVFFEMRQQNVSDKSYKLCNELFEQTQLMYELI